MQFDFPQPAPDGTWMIEGFSMGPHRVDFNNRLVYSSVDGVYKCPLEVLDEPV